MQDQPHWRRLLLRTEESAAAYEREIALLPKDGSCPLCKFETVIKEFDHWVLMKNKFPYDRYFTKSDMLVTKRHIPEGQLNEEERAEYFKIKNKHLSPEYDSAIEHMPAQKSIPEHVHVHMVEYIRPDGLPR